MILILRKIKSLKYCHESSFNISGKVWIKEMSNGLWLRDYKSFIIINLESVKIYGEEKRFVALH